MRPAQLTLWRSDGHLFDLKVTCAKAKTPRGSHDFEVSVEHQREVIRPDRGEVGFAMGEVKNGGTPSAVSALIQATKERPRLKIIVQRLLAETACSRHRVLP
jgi:hypothetical protein